MAKKTYSDLWRQVGNLRQEAKNVANYKQAATSLPYELKDEFRKRRDPKLDEQINRLQSQTFGAFTAGLNKYQDISNPFTRRDLAEKYQGGIENQWKNAVDERTRRQGVFSDYIDKWTGLFGAEAAKKQNMFNNDLSMWDKEKNLADTETSNRHWDITNARAERNSSKAGTTQDKNLFWQYAENDLNASVGEDAKYDPKKYRQIRDEAVMHGISKSTFDSQMSSGLSKREYEGLGIATKKLTPTQQNAQDQINERHREGNGTAEYPYKKSSDANPGDYYWSGTTKKKKGKSIPSTIWSYLKDRL